MKKTRIFGHAALFLTAWLAGNGVYAHDGDHAYTNGICTIEGCTDKFQAPVQGEDGYFEVANAGNVEWISDYVQNVAINPKVRMTSDIDFTGVSHTMIGRNDSKKFNGVWDGQGHRITNLVLNYGSADTPDAIGFFAWVRGGTTIKNLIMDKSCYFEGKVRVAAFVGVTQVVSGGAVRIENCVNEANVKGHTGATGGFIGCRNPKNQDTPQAIITGCANLGDITCDAKEAAAFVGWANSAPNKHIVENCYNLGNISSDGNNRGFIRGDNLQITNSYDFGSNAANNSQKATHTWVTAAPVASGELAYVINQAAGTPVFYQNLDSEADETPVPFSTSAQVYEVADYYCDGTPKGSVAYSNSSGGTIDDHVQGSNYICVNCKNYAFDGIENYKAPEADGFYHLSTVDDVEWFSAMVNKKFHGEMSVKLDNDIDFGGEPNAHTPIGTSAHKFFGHFDGQGHRIKGMVLTPSSRLENRDFDGQGFFGSVRGGGRNADDIVNNEVIIENLIIDASCSIQHDKNFVAGVVAHINSVNNNDSKIIIRNCGNEASVSTTGKNAAGILGCVEATNVGLILHNLWNKGKIVGNVGESAAICAWTGQRNVDGEVDVEGCWNIGEVTGVDVNGYNLVRRNSNIVPRNMVDLCLTNAGNQGKVTVLNTENPIQSGELCYLLNGDQTDIVFTQDLGTDEMPVYRDENHKQVFQAGTVNCLGASVGSISYNNVSGETIVLGHEISEEIGMCSVCFTQFQAPALVDGFYEIKNAGNLEWFSNKVDEGGDANLQINGKLMNDIDMLGITNLHKPIGVDTGKKYNGTFDGQGFRIKNLIIERPNDSNIGFFGFLRGNAANTTVRNLIMDKSCTIHGYNRVGGITGSCQNNGALITLENIVNEATVIAEHQDAAGIIGGQEGNGPKWLIRNVLNTGTITAKNEAPYAGALCCYLGGNGESVIENFVNLGTINGHRGGNIGRIAGRHSGIIDLSDTDFDSSIETNYGLDSGLTKEDIQNGKLAYTVGWGQLIGTDEMPSPTSTTKVSYVGDAGYATMYDTTTGYELGGNVTAYTVTTEYDEGNKNRPYIVLNAIENVPEGTPVVLKGTYYNKIAADLPAINVVNDLEGTDAPTASDGTMYILSEVNGKVCFYLAEGTIPAGKAYYRNTAAGDVKAFFFPGDNTTGIGAIDAQSSTTNGQPIYNLAGQRIQKMQKGLNIVGGKKILF